MVENGSLFWSTFYQSSVGQVLARLNGQYIAVNPAFCDFLGYTGKELLSIHPRQLSTTEDYEKDKHFLNQLTLGIIDKYQLEKRYIHKSGAIKWGLLSVSLIKNKSNNEEFVFGQVQEITEEKVSRDYLQKSEKISVAAQLAAAVAHEIRNPLTSIRGFTQLQKKDQTYNDHYTTIMLKELDKIENIITEYLAMGNPLSQTTFKEENIIEIMEQVITLLQAQANMANQEIVFTRPKHLPKIECNSITIKQTFLNIIKNALESMDEGKIVQVIINSAEENRIQIKIIDSGCGISRERLSNIGEPFYSTKERGTGIGLMTSFNIIEKHQGTIHIESMVNKGTTVTINLPIKQATVPI